MILCCGETLIDMIPVPTGVGQDGFVPHCGGAVFNTAIALGRLGVDTGMLTGLSTDVFGRQLAAALARSHVDASHVTISDRPTTLAFVHLSSGQATYNFYDENSAGRMLTPDDLPCLSPEISALFFGGISLACEPAADTYATLLARDSADRAVMLDPNIRLGVIGDADRYRARLDHMLTLADVVKVSDEDLNWLVPGSLPLHERAEALLSKGPAVVILTCGNKGAFGFQKGRQTVVTPAETVDIIDTVGAGDAFNAGVLASLSGLGQLQKSRLRNLSSDSLKAAMSYGAKVASITVSRAGANPPWAKEV